MATKNKQIDLHNILFEQLERLNDNEHMMDEENMEMELKRSQQIANIGKTMIGNMKLAYEVEKLKLEHGLDSKDVTELLSDGQEKI